MSKMTRKTESPNRNIDLEAMTRRSNVGGSASGASKQDADRPLLYDAVDFRLHLRRQRLAGSVVDRPVNVAHDGGEDGLAQCKSTQAAQDPRREHRAAIVSQDLWRFSCEMPDAPHLHDGSISP
jgi:hypothetical protein